MQLQGLRKMDLVAALSETLSESPILAVGPCVSLSTSVLKSL